MLGFLVYVMMGITTQIWRVGVNELLMDNEMNAQNKYLFIALSYLVEEQDKTYKTTIEVTVHPRGLDTKVL